ncbi:MAG: hypothetical protein SFU84_06760 [Gemmatimonadales bacterium]|nr:hypothetical protein [Gemmatimonadales bacterium]
MTRGATLLELAIIVALAALLAAIAVPPVRHWQDRAALDDAAHTLALAHARARLLALVEGRPMLLTAGTERLAVAAVAGADTALRWSGPGPERLGVAARGLPRQVLYATNGLAVGVANATITLTRGPASARVIVSRLGRVRLER